VATAETTSAPIEIFRNDYRPLPYAVPKVQMDIVIHDGRTQITTRMTIQPNHVVGIEKFKQEDWILDGDETSVKLMQLQWNGRELVDGVDYTLQPGKLVLHPKELLSDGGGGNEGGMLTTVTEIVPETNTRLSGLYKTGGIYCTQCEAMGFRRMTYYPDRPDNMAVFDSVRLEASVKDYPVLLSNGNLLESGSVENDRHYAIWQDPFPKPSYLFCCVAGNLERIQDSFQTQSGRQVQLQIFSEPNNVHKLHYAMESLKRSMKWDEDRFGLEYDLDLFNIVAVESFNMGAMENKVRPFY
jgi:aminopeptidase N